MTDQETAICPECGKPVVELGAFGHPGIPYPFTPVHEECYWPLLDAVLARHYR